MVLLPGVVNILPGVSSVLFIFNEYLFSGGGRGGSGPVITEHWSGLCHTSRNNIASKIAYEQICDTFHAATSLTRSSTKAIKKQIKASELKGSPLTSSTRSSSIKLLLIMSWPGGIRNESLGDILNTLVPIVCALEMARLEVKLSSVPRKSRWTPLKSFEHRSDPTQSSESPLLLFFLMV